MSHKKREEYPLSKTTSCDIDLQTAHDRFSGPGWQELQAQFDGYNEQFFNGILPKVLIITGGTSDLVGGMFFGRAIYVAKNDPFLMTCSLLHEMLHLSNRLMDVYDANHGFGWIESMIPIHAKLNIDLNIYELTEEEAAIWPHEMLSNYFLKAYFEKCFLEHGCLRPLPTGWQLERSPPKAANQTVVCQGDPTKDLEKLKDIFGIEYVEKITGRKNAIQDSESSYTC